MRVFGQASIQIGIDGPFFLQQRDFFIGESRIIILILKASVE
jgi:hypothetical protein